MSLHGDIHGSFEPERGRCCVFIVLGPAEGHTRDIQSKKGRNRRDRVSVSKAGIET